MLFINTGKKAPRKTRKIAGLSAMPNQMIASGSTPLRAKVSQPAISSAGTTTRSSPWKARVSRNAGLAGAASITEVILGLSRGLLQERIVHVLLRFRGDVLRNVFEIAHHRGD